MRIKLRPKIIDQYVFIEIIGPFIGGVAFFLFVFLMFQALRLADFFIVHGIPGLIIGKMVALLIISFLPLALPISFLISILVGFGRLSADSELVAMKSSGFSLFRLSLPVIAFSVVVTGFSLFLNLEWTPWAEREFKDTLIRVSNTKISSSVQEGTFTTGFYDLLIFTDTLDRDTDTLNKVFIYDERQKGHPLVVISKTGKLYPVKKESDLGAAAILRLNEGSIHQSNIEEEAYQRIDFNRYELFLEIEEGASTAALKPKMFSYTKLVKSIEEQKNAKKFDRYYIYLTELWRRVSIAISTFPFIFLGIGLGTVRTRSVRAGAALITFLVIVFYWVSQMTCTALAETGILPPMLVMQIPNVISLAIGFFTFRNASW